MSSFGTGYGYSKKDGSVVVFVYGTPDGLRHVIYEPSGVSVPEEFPETVLRLMCKWAVINTGDDIGSSQTGLRIMDDETATTMVEYKAGELDEASRHAKLPAIDTNRLDPDYSPVTLRIIEETPDPENPQVVLGRLIFERKLEPPGLS